MEMFRPALVVPCFNEANRFPLEAFRSFLVDNPSIRLILVNDGSKDGTAAVLSRMREGFPDRVFVIDRQENRGKAESVREGLLAALDLADRPDIVGFWDADLATPLEAVFQFLPILETQPGIQMVFGARVNLLGRDIRRRALRHYLGRVFATVVSVMLGLPIYDTQCGAKLFRVGPQTRELFQEEFSSRWVFDVEIIARWLKVNQFDHALVRSTIYEFPLHRWEDIGGSKVKPYDFVLAFRDVVRIYRRYFGGGG